MPPGLVELRPAVMTTEFDDPQVLNTCLSWAQLFAKGDGGRVEGACTKNTKEFFYISRIKGTAKSAVWMD